MKLSILNRINLGKLIHPDYVQDRLRHRYNFVEWSMSEEIGRKIFISADEQHQVSLTQENGQLLWNGDKDPMKDIEFSQLEIDFLVVILKELDGNKQLDAENGPLYRLFVVGGTN